MRLFFAIIFGKLARLLSRFFKKGRGTSLPGLVAEKICPQILPLLAQKLKKGCVIITGTNGKTTTSHMISSILRQANFSYLHNEAGANLPRGVISSLIKKANFFGQLDVDLGLFEVDEAMVPYVLKQVKPRLILFTNLFRDQLDRYGELDKIAKIWAQEIKNLSKETIVVINSDDPLVAHIAREARCKVIYFGIESEQHTFPYLPHFADSKFCSYCKSPLSYKIHFYSHLGKYFCRHCGLERPRPQIFASDIRFDDKDCLRIKAGLYQNEVKISLKAMGFYNVYNTLAATASSFALGIPLQKIKQGLEKFKPAFGRQERFDFKDKKAFLLLVKNPTGFNEVIRFLKTSPDKKNLILILNDNIPDGRDISWIWDVDFESLISIVKNVIVSGYRAEELALRLKYAGFDPQKIILEKDYKKVLKIVCDKFKDKNFYILPTYSAMLDFRDLLVKQGYLEERWEG